MVGDQVKRPDDSLTLLDFDPILPPSVYKGLESTYHK